jgi:hypothetical protein
MSPKWSLAQGVERGNSCTAVNRNSSLPAGTYNACFEESNEKSCNYEP